jgi:hypothetical protein
MWPGSPEPGGGLETARHTNLYYFSKQGRKGNIMGANQLKGSNDQERRKVEP